MPKVTVTVEGCPADCCQEQPPTVPGYPDVLIAKLDSAGQGNFGQLQTTFLPTVLNPSLNADINSYGSAIVYKSNGWYTVSLTCRVEPGTSENDFDEYPYGATVYGSHVSYSKEGASTHARFAESGGNGVSEFSNEMLMNDFGTDTQKVQWHDEFTVEITDFESQQSGISMYARKYAGYGIPARFSGVIKVTKIAPISAT